MKILMSSSDFLPNVGGVAAVVWELSRALARRGHEVRIAHWVFDGEHPVTDETRDDVRILRLRVSRYPAPWNRVLGSMQVRRYLSDLFAGDCPDFFHSHTLFPDGFAVRFISGRCARVFTNHTSDFLAALDQGWRRREWSWALRGFDCVLAPSTELADRSRECGARNVHFVSNGVDSVRFHPADAAQKAEARARLGIASSDAVILALRRFEQKNGLRYLAAAFAQIRDRAPHARLIFCGPDYDGTELAHVKRIFAEAGGERGVEFRGSIPNAQVPAFLWAADLSVLPSLKEATSIAGLEAMASGLPLIGTTVGGIPQIVQPGETGLLVPPKDSEALGNALLSLLQDPEARRRMGASARAAVLDRFDWDAIARQTETVYQTLIPHAPVATPL